MPMNEIAFLTAEVIVNLAHHSPEILQVIHFKCETALWPQRREAIHSQREQNQSLQAAPSGMRHGKWTPTLA
jgi:hypothetical protein